MSAGRPGSPAGAPAVVRRALIVLLLLAASLGAGGCTYLKHRGEDLMEVVDLGIIFSDKAKISLYVNELSLVCIGQSTFDGSFVGLGGGMFGLMDHTHQCFGALLAGREKIVWHRGASWRSYRQDQGILMLLGSERRGGPAYLPASVHFAQVTWVGLAANLRFTELLDFLLGWFTLDICCDDGQDLARWP
ncbi:MAG: hypothetical protein ACYS8K_04225 [Planctomycetota bacterium]|jgi:hypothetical protein